MPSCPVVFSSRRYDWADLLEEPQAMRVVDGIFGAVRQSLLGCESMNDRAFQTMVNDMWNETFGRQFCYADCFGGLCHVQFSRRTGVDLFIVAPVTVDFPLSRPLDRLSMQFESLICTLAPADVKAIYRTSVLRNDVGIDAAGVQVIGAATRACDDCLGTVGKLFACSCGMVRYCGATCQSYGWKKHKPLCRWARACIRAFGSPGLIL